jgi:hypothetical protein
VKQGVYALPASEYNAQGPRTKVLGRSRKSCFIIQYPIWVRQRRKSIITIRYDNDNAMSLQAWAASLSNWAGIMIVCAN